MVQVQKKLILFLGQPDTEIASGIQSSLVRALSPSAVAPQIVWAKDGNEASWKLANQKFDAVVVDTQANRLWEGTTLNDLRKACLPGKADMIALVPNKDSKLPQELERASQVLEKPYDLDMLVRALSKALVSETRVEAPPQNKSGFAVDVRVLNSILKSTIFVCQQYGLGKIVMQKPQVKNPGGKWNGEIAATIAIQSKLFQGAMVISFQKAAYLYLYNSMLGVDEKELSAENSEAIGEICNMILGNAKSEITSYDVGMSIPKMLKPGEPIQYPAGSASILLVGHSNYGNLFIEVIAFQMKKAAA
jgi:chemotaxis protein CheX